MTTRVYLRVARTQRGFTWAATAKPSLTPLLNGLLPTLTFSVDVTLPDDAFDIAHVGELHVDDLRVVPAVALEEDVS